MKPLNPKITNSQKAFPPLGGNGKGGHNPEITITMKTTTTTTNQTSAKRNLKFLNSETLKLRSSALRHCAALCLLLTLAINNAAAETYQHVFSAKPNTGSSITLSNVSWTITATELGSYNSANYAGVQIGSSSKSGSIKLTSTAAWSYNGNTKITEVRLWLNTGGQTVTPTVTIGGKSATSDGTTVTKNNSAASDWTKTTKVTFTPAADGNSGVVVINISSAKAGYVCAMEIDCESSAPTTEYAINWSVDGVVTTEQTSGGKIATLPTAPTVPSGCSGKVFVGWSETNIGSTPTATAPADLFTTAPTTTITSDKTYYAVFGNGTAGSDIVLWAENFAHFGTKTPSAAGMGSGTTVYGGGTVTYTQSNTGTKAYAATLAGGTSPELLLSKSNETWTISGIPTNGATQMTLTFLSNKTAFALTSSTTGITISGSEKSWIINNTANASTFDLTLKNTGSDNARIDNVSLVDAGIPSTAYITTCEACDAPATALSLTSTEASLNLGESGTASTTLSTAGGNGGAVTYSASPSEGVTFGGNSVTFSAAGTYTISASQPKNGTYCAQNATATITVTENPVVNITAVSPATLQALCGAEATATLTVSGYNLGTTDIALTSNDTRITLSPATITPTDGKVSSQAVTVTYTATAGQSTESGTATITATSGTATSTASVGYQTTGCEKVRVVFRDQNGNVIWETDDYAQNTIASAPAFSGTCTGYTFDGWSETPVTDASTYTEVTFPYTITGAKTLYAVYRTSGGSISSDFWIASVPDELNSGDDYILTAYSSSTEYALTCNAATTSGKLATKAVTTTKVDGIDEIQGVADNTIVWKLVGDATNGYAFLSHSTGTYLTVDNGNLVLAKDPTTKYKFTHPDATKYAVTVQQVGGTNYLSGYSYPSVMFEDYTSNQLSLYLYVRKPSNTYTTSPVCCSSGQEVTVVPASQSINLVNGTASTTVATTPASGVTYSLYPTTGATIATDGTFTATAAGVYTIIATYSDGSCSSAGSNYVAVTKLPVFEAPTIDQAAFTVECGDTTSVNTGAATITLGTNCNLTKTVTVTAPDGFLVSTNKTDKTKYDKSVTLTPVASTTSANYGKITNNIYVRAYAPVASNTPYSGDITFSGDEIETQTIAVSSTVTCTEYAIVFNNRGAVQVTKSGWATTTVDAAADPTGVCTTPVAYEFVGWSEEKVTGSATSVSLVTFPYTIPKGGKTLYAVYRYSEDGSTGPSKVGLSAITDGGKYFITATHNSAEYVLKAAKFSAGGGSAVEFNPTTIDESAAWTFTKYGTAENQWYIKSGDNYLYCTKDNNGLTCGTTSDYFTASASDETSTTIKLKDNNQDRYVSLYNNSNWRCYTNSSGVQDIQLYKLVSYSYTTSPTCGPYLLITGGREVYVTSGNAGSTRSSVQSQDTIRFVAGALKPNTDSSAPQVQVFANQAKYQHNVSDGTLNRNISTAINQTVTKNDDEYTIEGTIVVTYKPTANNTLETVRIVPHITYNTNATLDSATVYARALPEKFVIAAKNGDKWYALPADMATSGTYAGNGQLVVNNAADPTEATYAPCNTIYTFDGMPSGSDLRYARFVGLGNKYLWASSEGNTGIQNYAVTATGANQSYNWLLQTTDLVTYTIGNAQNSRSLSLSTASSTLNNFGMYANSNITALRILPMVDSCAYNVAPQGLRVSAKKSTELTLVWGAVAGADAYQYSTDSTTWTDIAGIDLAAPSLTRTGLTAGTEYTIYIRAKHGAATTICSDAAKIVATTANCDNPPTVTAAGTVTQDCGVVALGSDFSLTTTVQSATLCPATAYGIEYSTDKTFATGVQQVEITATSGAIANLVTIDAPGDYYFRAYATNEVGTGYSDLLNGGAHVDITGVAGLKIMFENDDNTAPLVAGKAKKRVVYYSASPAAVSWSVSGGGAIADGYFTASTMGVYTITATQAADGDYCAATATAIIEVRTPRYHSLITNCAKLNNGNIEVINQHRGYMDVAVDSADIVKITIVRDNTGQSTGHTGNAANDLFFSKYYESIGNLKLIAIYNGTSSDIDISNVRITVGAAGENGTTTETDNASLVKTTAGNQCIPLNKVRIPNNIIKAGQEIVLYTFGGTNKDGVGTSCPNQVDNQLLPTIDNVLKETTGTGIIREGWYDLETNAHKITSGSVQPDTNSLAGQLLWSGRQAIALMRGDEMIDIIGSYHNGTIYKYYAGDGIVAKEKTLGDAVGWAMEGYLYDLDKNAATEKKGTISTNRNLLIRLNTVVDGKNAVKENLDGDFVTLGYEWAGMQLGSEGANDENRCLTASYFSAIAGFDYGEYFQRYEPISDSIKITAPGVRNEDGTFRISAGDIIMDGFTDFSDLSCSSIKIQGFKEGSDKPSTTLDYKVPIIVDASTTTKDETLFGFDGKGRAICPDCDVVIRDNAKLEVAKGGYNQLRDVYVYHTGRLQIAEGYTYNTRHVYVSSDNNDVGYALVEGTLSALLGVGHYKRIDALAWYDFALPYDCKVADIARSNGKSLGEYGKDWFIKYYDGQKRAITGTPNGATNNGTWVHVPANGTLKAGVGYIIGIGGLHEVAPNLPQYKVRISLPNVSGQIYTETNVSDQQLPVVGYTGAAAERLPCHRGWNYIGNPFISRFDGKAQKPEWSTELLLNGYYTDPKDGETYTNENPYEDIYVAVNDPTDPNYNWVQSQASEANLLPFRAFFVQAVSDGKVDFVKTARNLPAGAPASRAATNASSVSQFNLVLTNASGVAGTTCVMIGDQFNRTYEVGHDMLRMINKAQTYPQPYTIDSAGYAMIRQAIDRETPVNQTIPVGFYLRTKGNYTFSIDRLQGMSRYDAVYLEDNTLHTTTDLLLGDYTFAAAAGTTEGRFSLHLRASSVPTDITDPEGGVPVVYRHGDALVIESLPAGAQVRIVDAIGRVLHQQRANGNTITFHAPVRGAYLIQVVSGNDSYSIKTIL